jgi:hypothetical protein
VIQRIKKSVGKFEHLMFSLILPDWKKLPYLKIWKRGFICKNSGIRENVLIPEIWKGDWNNPENREKVQRHIIRNWKAGKSSGIMTDDNFILFLLLRRLLHVPEGVRR